MSKKIGQTDLFIRVVPLDRVNPAFEHFRNWNGAEPARLLMNEVFSDFTDPDGNFVEQFQTTGFDSRTFELYLYAYLQKSGYKISRDHPYPDFIVTRENVKVAIEATTANPSVPGFRPIVSKDPPHELSEEEVKQKIEQKLPIRLGSPLFSKLQKHYWDLDHCKNLPFVIAIEAFHEINSLHFSDAPLSNYLYGLKPLARWTESGQLIVENIEIQEHRLGDKVIPSNFFGQPGAEFVSAVLFTNSGTYPKFNRLGYQKGYHRGNIRMHRVGKWYNPDPNSGTPFDRSYNLEFPPFEETWAQGLVVFHNPNAINPLPHDYFEGAVIHYFKDGQVYSDIPKIEPVPFSSITIILCDDDPEIAPNSEARPSIHSVLSSEFDTLHVPRKGNSDFIFHETEWFVSDNKRVAGIVVNDLSDDDWSYVFFTQTAKGRYRYENSETNISARKEARRRLLDSMAAKLANLSRSRKKRVI